MNINIKTYRYDKLWHIVIYIWTSFLFIVWVAFTLIPFGVIFGLIEQEGSINITGMIISSLLSFILIGLPTVTIANMFSVVTITTNGLQVQTFLFWWVFIPWDDIIFIQAYQMGRYHIIGVNYLTPIHKHLFGIWYGKPVFYIYKGINGYTELIQIIKEETGSE